MNDRALNRLLVLLSVDKYMIIKINSRATNVILLYFRRTARFFFIWVFFHEHSQYTEQQGKGEAVSNFSLPPLPASQTLRHQMGDYGRELTSAHSQDSELNREPVASDRELLTTKVNAYMFLFKQSTLMSEKTQDLNLP